MRPEERVKKILEVTGYDQVSRLYNEILGGLKMQREEALEEAAKLSEDMGKYVNGGYNAAAYGIGEAIRKLKE